MSSTCLACTSQCVYTCSSSCSGSCNDACSSSCYSESTCSNNCTSQCSVNCGSGCMESCSSSCESSCSGDCSLSCISNCLSGCSSSCLSSCTQSCEITCSQNCSGGCSKNCSTLCVSGCSSSCKSTCGTSCVNACSHTSTGKSWSVLSTSIISTIVNTRVASVNKMNDLEIGLPINASQTFYYSMTVSVMDYSVASNFAQRAISAEPCHRRLVPNKNFNNRTSIAIGEFWSSSSHSSSLRTISWSFPTDYFDNDDPGTSHYFRVMMSSSAKYAYQKSDAVATIADLSTLYVNPLYYSSTKYLNISSFTSSLKACIRVPGAAVGNGSLESLYGISSGSSLRVDVMVNSSILSSVASLPVTSSYADRSIDIPIDTYLLNYKTPTNISLKFRYSISSNCRSTPQNQSGPWSTTNQVLTYVPYPNSSYYNESECTQGDFSYDYDDNDGIGFPALGSEITFNLPRYLSTGIYGTSNRYILLRQSYDSSTDSWADQGAYIFDNSSSSVKIRVSNMWSESNRLILRFSNSECSYTYAQYSKLLTINVVGLDSQDRGRISQIIPSLSNSTSTCISSRPHIGFKIPSYVVSSMINSSLNFRCKYVNQRLRLSDLIGITDSSRIYGTEFIVNSTDDQSILDSPANIYVSSAYTDDDYDSNQWYYLNSKGIEDQLELLRVKPSQFRVIGSNLIYKHPDDIGSSGYFIIQMYDENRIDLGWQYDTQLMIPMRYLWTTTIDKKFGVNDSILDSRELQEIILLHNFVCDYYSDWNNNPDNPSDPNTRLIKIYPEDSSDGILNKLINSFAYCSGKSFMPDMLTRILEHDYYNFNRSISAYTEIVSGLSQYNKINNYVYSVSSYNTTPSFSRQADNNHIIPYFTSGYANYNFMKYLISLIVYLN